MNYRPFDLSTEHKITPFEFSQAYANFVGSLRVALGAGKKGSEIGDRVANAIVDHFDDHYNGMMRRSDFQENFTVHVAYNMWLCRYYIQFRGKLAINMWQQRLYDKLLQDARDDTIACKVGELANHLFPNVPITSYTSSSTSSSSFRRSTANEASSGDGPDAVGRNGGSRGRRTAPY
ncbi:hypothetical protein DXG01_001099 [Tephrocybe rancida]|nr:hypothetical protein DXG01_001099 [Tephrocybe rancida]